VYFRNKRRPHRSPLEAFIARACRDAVRITATLVESLINQVRAKNLAQDALSVIYALIDFAKNRARLEPDAVRFIHQHYGFIHIPQSAVFPLYREV